jgi:hypothetical protein
MTVPDGSPISAAVRSTGTRLPGASYAHLHRLSDDVSLFEHAEHSTPRTSHGYCVDDVARGLLIICREPGPPPDLLRLGERYLAFLVEAQSPPTARSATGSARTGGGVTSRRSVTGGAGACGASAPRRPAALYRRSARPPCGASKPVRIGALAGHGRWRSRRSAPLRSSTCGRITPLPAGCCTTRWSRSARCHSTRRGHGRSPA